MTEPYSEESSPSEFFANLKLHDYLAIARRRRAWWILTATSLFVIATVVAFRLPDTYRSETTIIVDPQQVPNVYVTSTVSSSIMDRLSTLRQQVMSPSRLKRLYDKLNLYPDLRGRMSEQEILLAMQKKISIEVVDAGAQRLSAFRLAFYSKSPEEAALVANQLAAMLIEDNLKARAQQFSGTAEFLESELSDTKKQLEAKESELQRIKSANIMDLPESKQYHLEQLTNLRIQLRSIQDRVARAQQERVYLQSLLLSSSPTVDLDADGSGARGSGRQSQIQKLESRLSELRSRYGPGHPDVRKLQTQLDALKAAAATEEQEAPTPAGTDKPAVRGTRRNPVLEAQLNRLVQEIEEQTKLQAPLEQQINFHASKLERVPLFEQQMSGLMRDYDTLRVHYNGLLDKKLSAEMASELETRQKGERFVILDSAPVPQEPYSPNRPMIILAGLIGGLLGGLGLATVAEMQDESVRNEREAARVMGKPVLVGIPRILNKQQRRQMRLRSISVLAGTVACSAVIGFVLSFITGRLL